MSEEQKQKESLILVALGKAFSEQAIFLTGQFRQKQKQTFNESVKTIDLFVRNIESQLKDEQIEFLQSIGDIYHNINLEIRRS